MTLIQGAGVAWPGLQNRHILGATVGEAAEAVEELKVRNRLRRRCSPAAAAGVSGRQQTGRCPGLDQAVELVEQAAALRHEHDTGDRDEQRPRLCRHQIGT